MTPSSSAPIVAISQRVVEDQSRAETRDSLDQKWTQILEPLGVIVVPVPNLLLNISLWLQALSPSLIILSGGNDLAYLGTPESSLDRDNTEMMLLNYATAGKVPVLGVCRGMQFLVHASGGSLTSLSGHAGTRHSVVTVESDSTWGAFGERTVDSYHNWGVMPDGIPPNWNVLAAGADGSIEAIAHSHLPQVGVMWHPERGESHPQDILLLETLLKLRP